VAVKRSLDRSGGKVGAVQRLMLADAEPSAQREAYDCGRGAVVLAKVGEHDDRRRGVAPEIQPAHVGY
jgi:hypothetical protein